ncbi:MAG: tetratricopeptide repeat protein [Anaerolineae bacterium]
MVRLRKKKDFEERLRKAHRLAWGNQWQEALQLYREVVEEQPRTLAAYLGLAQAQAALGQVDEAHQTLTRALKLDPKDPLTVTRRADLLLQARRTDEALQDYDTAAALWLEQNQEEQSWRIWQKLTRTLPDHPLPPHRLACHLEDQGAEAQALAAYLQAARLYQKRDDRAQAQECCQAALRLDPGNGEALLLMEAIREGGLPREVPRPVAPAPGEGGGPAIQARELALSELATEILSAGARGEQVLPPGHPVAEAVEPPLSVESVIGQAIDLQMRGRVDQAIEAYQQALELGADRPAIHFNLGLLYREKLRFDEAIEHLTRSQREPAYAIGSHYALAECYRARGDVDRALSHFVEVLKIVDLQTVNREQADNLIRLYEHLAESHLAKGERARGVAFMNSLVQFLGSKGWEDKVRQARERLDELTATGLTISLAELLDVPHSQEVFACISMSQEYARRGLYLAAMAECYQGIALAPLCLPLHLHLAEILLKAGRTDEAVGKLAMTAETYAARGEYSQAVSVYRRLLKIAPMDVKSRSRAIDLLLTDGRVEEALQEYVGLAESYYQLAQLDKALETYREAVKLASQISEPRRWQTRLLHRMGDIYLQRVEWRQAIQVYAQIKGLAPEDERARFCLVDLHLKMREVAQAVRELDALLRVYRDRGEPQKELSLLQELAAQWPDEIPLRSRLAHAYLEQGETQKAVAELDNLGELQLRAGQKRQAAETVRLLISLAPDEAESYKRLLSQIEGS